jgi:hypothetical protein
MRNDLRYTPSDCFETFAKPELTAGIGDLGGALHARRSAVMRDRDEGLTKTYNRVHDRDEASDDIARLRELHADLDHAVRDAYGWSDLDLGHGFQDTRFGVRFTFEPVARQEILDRLLELNQVRYADEVRRGLHAKAKGQAARPDAGRRNDAGISRFLTPRAPVRSVVADAPASDGTLAADATMAAHHALSPPETKGLTARGGRFRTRSGSSRRTPAMNHSPVRPRRAWISNQRTCSSRPARSA